MDEVPPDSVSPRGRLIRDLEEGLKAYPVWTILGWQDIRQRYRRSTLGPLWITLSLAITVATMGVLYGKLFHQEIHRYLPYLTSGMVIWSLVSMMITDSTTVFSGAAGIIRQIRLPLSLHVLRMMTRNLVLFGHNMIVFVAVALLFGVVPGWSILLFPVALLLWMATGLWMGLLLGAFCARFRDVAQIVMSLVQILFFLTPVMWYPSSLGHYAWISWLNPLSQYFDILRDPLLGQNAPLLSWLYVMGTTLAGWLLVFLLFPKYRARVALLGVRR
ncbi:MAG: hypothetical protein D084_Lepto4C00615G0001 [Leptospirillum sp. Group IV 'UBA BS']|nr:MAG: hypothetical protein D084_Lepto4C00615G0001 [Leptospirillum sp. Group IV 'UBA BS']